MSRDWVRARFTARDWVWVWVRVTVWVRVRVSMRV